jgi:hypothetical protein
MIGKQKKPEITRMSQLQEELRNTSFDKLKIFEKITSEPPRDCRRLQLLRRWSHDKQDDEQILS